MPKLKPGEFLHPTIRTDEHLPLHERLESGEFSKEKSARLSRLPLNTMVCGYCCEDPSACDCGETEHNINRHIVELRHALTHRKFARRPPGTAKTADAVSPTPPARKQAMTG